MQLQCVCTHIWISNYVCIYILMYIHKYIYTYTCIYIYIDSQIYTHTKELYACTLSTI